MCHFNKSLIATNNLGWGQVINHASHYQAICPLYTLPYFTLHFNTNKVDSLQTQ